MVKRLITVALLSVSIVSAQSSERIKPVYKVTRLSATEVGVSCLNGADPTGRKIGDTVILSCGAGGATVALPTYHKETDKWTCPDGFNVYASEAEALSGKADFVHCVR